MLKQIPKTEIAAIYQMRNKELKTSKLSEEDKKPQLKYIGKKLKNIQKINL